MAKRNIGRKELKVAFLEALEKSLGVITVAAKSVGLTRATVYNWMADDPKFKEAVDAVNDIQCDFVESKLLKLIGEDDPSAIIFYLKTKGKKRGYTERGDAGIAKPAEKPAAITEDVRFTIEVHRQTIVRRLVAEGKYSPELDNQIEVAAQLEYRRDVLAARIFSADYSPINTEYSREGSVRQSVNPLEGLFIDINAQLQKSLKALGMNTDSKERAGDGEDTSADFLSKHKIEQL